jgi:hypothetical protein
MDVRKKLKEVRGEGRLRSDMGRCTNKVKDRESTLSRCTSIEVIRCHR